jgi:16S rRNA (uracil1498-N3)-methyltransferase
MSFADKHTFSIYTPNFFDQNYTVGVEKKVVDEDINHRLVKVLRIQVGQQIIFFDQEHHALIEILDISKKFFSIKVLTFEKNIKQATEIKFLLPLLKKEALEEAVYSLAEIGVSEIQLVITQKSRQKLLHEKEFCRLESIIIAAAEQSKNYIFPKIHTPVDLFDLELESNSSKIVFEPQGESFFELRLQGLQEKICLLVGPEGGLTKDELQHLEQIPFQKCHLTPTILRAVQAVALGAGLFKI